MRLLLDTDVLLDVALDREPHAAHAIRVLDAVERGAARAHVAWHSISNLYYLVEPRQGAGLAREFVMELFDFVAIAPTTTESLRYAGGLQLADFEDAMQVAAAMACRAERIVTRNVRHYCNSPIRAETPAAIARVLG